MEETQNKVEILLEGIKTEIITSLEQGQVENAEFFLEQYIKISPHSIDRYSLQTLINMEKEDLKGAETTLKEGLKHHPMSFDLLYNLGYTFQHQGEILEAYHIYMKAKYIAEREDEKTDIAKALKSLVDDFAGTVSVDENISIIVRAGKTEIKLNTSYENVLKRKDLLMTIEKHMDKDSDTVLEIGFEDGIISKNLNYLGYDVTAVDPIKTKIINVIAREWHDNILQPEHESAKFYHDEVSLEWMNKIPEFDTIIVASNSNIELFDIDKEKKKDILRLLIEKSKRQLFIKVCLQNTEKEFTREDLLEVISLYNLKFNLVYTEETEDKGYEIYMIEKEQDIKYFKIPTPLEIRDSKSTVIELELEKCKDLFGAGYIGDYHPFVEVLKQYEENPNLQYKDSVLKEYYDNFQPKNLEEGLFGQRGKAPKLRKGWIGYPWDWEKEQRVIFMDKLKDTRPGGIHFFGPNTIEFGQGEFDRLIKLYTMFKRQGYHPELFSDGYISGYCLIKENDYRFIVTEGQHRIAVLAALGYKNIRCRLTHRPEYPQIVDIKDAKKWPQVENRAYSRNYATKIFNRFFEGGVGQDRLDVKLD